MGKIDQNAEHGDNLRPKGFSLFAAGEPWQINACLNYSHTQESAYIEGYRQAAEILMEAATNHEGTIDCLVYPIVFLHRQHLELQMKEILTLFRKTNRNNQNVPLHHKLETLWRDCRALILVEDWGKAAKADLDCVSEVVKQISLIDPNSDAFRYRRSSKGEVSAKTVKHIHLGNFHTVLAWTSEWLDGVICQLDSDVAVLDEMRSYNDT